MSVTSLKAQLCKLQEPPAALIIEPIIGINGVYVLPREFLFALQEIASATGAMLIFDEILTGFWRTGKCFAFQEIKCIPDAVCFGKGLTSGYIPLSGILLGSRWQRKLTENPLRWGTTNFAHPLACATALSVLTVLSGPAVQAQLVELASLAWNLANEIAQSVPKVITGVHGLGLLLGLHLCPSFTDTDRDSRVRTMTTLRRLLYKHGVLVEIDPVVGVVPIAPPFVISEEQLSTAIRSVDKALREAVARRLLRLDSNELQS
jgi:adenosylmethionine-8-amino-7-oxononanoate aminotransferase